MNHMAAYCVNSARIGYHHNGFHAKGGGSKHHLLPGHNGIYCDESRLDDLLKVSYFMLQEAVVIAQPVSVILDADQILETEGEPGPGMAFELWQVDEGEKWFVINPRQPRAVVIGEEINGPFAMRVHNITS